MTHEDERPFHDRLVEHLVTEYGEDAVRTDVYLKETGRWVDVLVETPLVTLALEVENDWESVIMGIGQANLYAAHVEEGAVPVVAVPPGHVEEPEVSLLRRRGVIIREVDV